jgi:hypothetical protein
MIAIKNAKIVILMFRRHKYPLHGIYIESDLNRFMLGNGPKLIQFVHKYSFPFAQVYRAWNLYEDLLLVKVLNPWNQRILWAKNLIVETVPELTGQIRC